MKAETIKIDTPFIRLDSLMKLAGMAVTGGQAKMAIQGGMVLLNGSICLMRGKKIVPGDEVSFGNKTVQVEHEG